MIDPAPSRLLAVLTFLFAAALVPAAAPRLDREKLLEYRAADGSVQAVRSPADWARRRAEIVAGAEAVMGPLPGAARRVPLDVQVERETDVGEFVRREISYAAEPGARVPAYLLIPKDVLAGRAVRPGVLALMPTNNVANASANFHSTLEDLRGQNPKAKLLTS